MSHSRRFSFIAAVLALSLIPCHAASTVGPALPGVFRQTDLDAGGWLSGFASHPSGVLYARTDVGGVYRSDNHGDSWNFISGNLPSAATHSVQSIAVGTTSADLLFQAVGVSYLGTDPGRGIWKTMDGGGSWTQVLTGVNFSGNDDLRWQGEAMAITPGSLDQEIFAISRQAGLWRSTTGGGAGSWTKQNGSVFDDLIGHVVQMDAAFPNDLFVGGIKGSGSALYKGTRAAGGSITWSPITVSAATTSVSRLARLPSGVLFAALQDGVLQRFYKSNTTGTSWTNITSTVLGGLTDNGPVGMCHVLRDQTTIVLGWIGGPTRKSTDGGTTWSTLPLTITGPRPTAMLTSENAPGWSRGAIHQDPIDPNRWYLPNGYGPFLTTDAGATVQYMTRGIGEVVAWKPAFHPADPSRIYLPVSDLIGFVVTDGGATGLAQRNPRRQLPNTFGNVGMTYSTKVLLGPVTGNGSPLTYYLGGAYFGPNAGRGCILTTPDDGVTWSLVHVSGLTGSSLPATCEITNGSIAPDNSNEILVAVNANPSSGSGIYRSTDGGVSFTKSTGIPTGGNWGSQFDRFVSMEADTTTATRRFAWVCNLGFLISNDRGVTWTATGHSTAGPASNQLYDWNTWGSLTRDATTGRLWYGGFGNHLGLAYSINQGTNWTYLDAPDTNTGFSEIITLDAANSQLIVFGKRQGDTFRKLYYSSDNGLIWRECTGPAFRLPTTSAVALDLHHPGQFWVGSNGRSYARFAPGAFGNWQRENFTSQELNTPTVSAATADPDADQSPNLVEYALASDPRLANPNSPNWPRISSTPPATRTVQFQRNPAATDITYSLLTSPDLTAWTTAQTFTGTAILPTAFSANVQLIEDPGSHQITYRPATTGLAKEFYRLAVTLPGASSPPPVVTSFPTNPLSPITFNSPSTLTTTSTAGATTDYLFVPSSYNSNHQTPTTLFVWLHGCGGYSSGDVWTASLSSSQSWITLAPGGAEGGCWDMNTDPAKVLASIANVKSRFNIQPKRIILGGYSSGGDLSYRMAFYNANSFAGVLAANTAPFQDTGFSQADSLAAAAWKFNIVHLAHLQDTTYPISTVRSEISALTAAGYPITLIERPGNHYDPAGTLVNGQPVPGTGADIRSLFFPYLDAGWSAP